MNNIVLQIILCNKKSIYGCPFWGILDIFPLGSISSLGGKYCALWHAVIIIDFPTLEFIEIEILNKNGHTWAYLWLSKMTLLYRNDIWLLWPCSSVTSSKNRNVYISSMERDFDARFFLFTIIFESYHNISVSFFMKLLL